MGFHEAWLSHPDGRRITVRTLTIGNTYGQMMTWSGPDDSCNQMMINRQTNLADSLAQPECDRAHIISPTMKTLENNPNYLPFQYVIAKLVSYGPDEPTGIGYLTILFWTDSAFERPVLDVLSETISTIIWRACATPYDIDLD